jgi:hypothetical protein
MKTSVKEMSGQFSNTQAQKSADLIEYDDFVTQGEHDDHHDHDDHDDHGDDKDSTNSTQPTEGEITFSNLVDTYTSASNTSNQQTLDKVKEFVNRMKVVDILHVLSGLSNYEPELRELLMKRLMLTILKSQVDETKSMDFVTLRELLSREDYDLNGLSAEFDLENILGSICTSWFNQHADETPEHFKECFSLVRQRLLKPGMIAKFVKCPQYKQVENELAPRFVELYTATLTEVQTTEKQRYSSNQEKLESKHVLSADDHKSLKKDDVVDAKDTDGVWYVATVRDVTPNSAYVTFTGWGSKFDEWLDFSEKRIANRGSMTNGKIHVTSGQCDCIKCIRDQSIVHTPFCMHGAGVGAGVGAGALRQLGGLGGGLDLRQLMLMSLMSNGGL